jgi:hypothetical protein
MAPDFHGHISLFLSRVSVALGSKATSACRHNPRLVNKMSFKNGCYQKLANRTQTFEPSELHARSVMQKPSRQCGEIDEFRQA